MELSGSRYGHIRVNERIGDGGMGSVYEGFDETLHRRVAVKVLQDDQRLDPEARGRLVREARSLSRLDHPNICRIHDYIQQDDVDLLVLEYIEGRTLRDAINAGLSRAEKLRIAISIAEVLVVAHRAGIIHRDLKPENVMLTSDGTVKVLDFGLARWTEERVKSVRAVASDARLWPLDERTTTAAQPQLLTQVGLTVGTPLFMSPEQARGEKLTPASDVHSFGLLLQTLFSGRDPYPDDLSPRAILLKAATNASLPVTNVDRRIAAFINDLKQYAPTDRPTAVDAVQRLRQLEIRPRRIAQAAAASLLALLLVSGAAKYTVDLRRERAAAVASEHRATIARQEAATRRAQAEDLITFMLGDLRTKLEPLGKLDVLDDVGERALAYSASLNPALMSSDELARSAKALGQLGAVRIAQGRLAEAAPVFAQSLQMAQAAVRKDPANQNAQLVQMAAHFGVGECARLSGRSADALREMELYLATARSLSAAHPANAEYRMEEAYGHANVGTLLMGSGRFADAGAHFAEALRIKRARLARDPSNAEWRADLANTIYKLGMNLHKTGDLAGARVQFEEQKRIRQELVAAEPDNAQSKTRLATAYGHLATVLLSMGEMHGAEQELHAALDIERALAAQDAENAEWTRNFAVTTARVAGLDARQGRTAEAVAGYRHALSMLEEVVQRDPSRVSFRGDLDVLRARSVMNDVARGDLAGARRTWERIGARSPETPERQMELLLAGMILGDATHDTQQASESRDRARVMLATPSVRASTDPELIAIRARLLVALGQRDDAAPLIARLEAIGYHHPEYEASIRGQ